jgi:hypothetical protein
MIKSILFLLVILPVVSCFVSLNVPQHLLKPVATRLYEQQPTSTEGSATKTNNSTMSDADFIAKQTVEMLEAMGDEAENADEEEEEEYPIFNPNSFWTDRSGRFPRKMNE